MPLRQWRIDPNDSDDLAFVLWALASQAITMDEFRQWALRVVSEVENPPEYFFALIDFHGHLKDIDRVLGFVTTWEPSAGEQKALYGLAYLRGVQPYEVPPREACVAGVREHPDIHRMYVEMFPGVTLSGS